MSLIFQCGYPQVDPTPGGFAALQSYGGLRGCSDETGSHLKMVDAAFNGIHGTGPQLADMKDPIKSTIERISKLLDCIPVPVIKVNLLNNSQFITSDLYFFLFFAYFLN